jgi:esterase/lipase
MKILKYFFIVLILLFLIIFIFGSRPDTFETEPVINMETIPISTIDQYIADLEDPFDVRPGNEAHIIWADSTKRKTAYSLVYLHGFSASHMEGYPVHQALAKRFGLNLYLSRLSEHGLNSAEPLEELEADRLVESAKEAIHIGQQIGDNVIVMGTSTGATLAIYLAAFNPELIDILLFFAPNINVADQRSFLLTYPGGETLAEFLEGDYLHQGMSGEEFNKYWYPQYKTNSVVELLSLIEHTMTTEVFNKVKQPTFVSFYYKNEIEKDDIISTEAIHSFYEQLGTEESRRRIMTSPNSGNHVTISYITSKDIVTPYRQACDFLEEVCGLVAVDLIGADSLVMRK